MSAVISSVQANAEYAVLAWEPVHGSGERLNVGALVRFNNSIHARALIREEVLRCMYGAAGEGAFQMIQATLRAAETVAKQHGFAAACEAAPLATFGFGYGRETWAENDLDLLRQIVLMHFSLSVLTEEPESSSDESPTPEREVNQQWTTKVKEAIQARRPDLTACFNRELVLVEGSAPVRFPVVTPHLAAQFGLLKINTQGQGMEDARAKMWKLALARERNHGMVVAMVLGTPPLGDVTISDRVRDRLLSNVADLEREAVKYDVNLRQAHTAAEAADFVIQMA